MQAAIAGRRATEAHRSTAHRWQPLELSVRPVRAHLPSARRRADGSGTASIQAATRAPGVPDARAGRNDPRQTQPQVDATRRRRRG